MAKTYGKNIFRTIRSTLSRFIAIFAIVALGVGFLAGLLSSPVDMRYSADQYYDETNFYDLKIQSTLGLTQEDLEALQQVDGLAGIMPAYDSDFVLKSQEGDSYTTRMHSLPDDLSADDPNYLNQLVLLEGRMPEKAGECVVLENKSLVNQVDLMGQTLTLDPDEEDMAENVVNEFTVVGKIKGPAYLSVEQEYTTAGTGRLNLFAYTVEDSFQMDYYTTFYATVENAKEENAYDTSYETLIEEVKEQLEPLGEERSQIRYETLVSDAQQTLDDAKEEYEEKKAEVEQQLADGEKELADAQKEIDDSQAQLDDAKAQIDSGRQELADSKDAYAVQIASAQQQIEQGYATLATYQAQLDAGLAQVQEAQSQLDQGFQQLEAGEAKLEESRTQLETTQQSLDGLDVGKANLWVLAQQFGIAYGDTSDSSALQVIASLQALLSSETSPLPPEETVPLLEQLGSLQTGLNALAAQGLDTASARQQLEQGWAEYEKGAQEAAETRKTLEQQQAQLTEKAEPLYAQQQELQNQKAQLDSSNAQLQQTMASSQAQFAQAEQELNDAEQQYQDGLVKLEEGKASLEDGRKEYEEGKQEAEEKLTEAEEKIRDGESQIREIETGQWYLFDRQDNLTFSSYGSNADKIAAIATVFPLFFFLVAALVSLTTMTRMVEEERQQVGTLKALGYSNGKIAMKYLIYAAVASVAGSVLGLLVGMNLFPYVIINAYNIMFDYPYVLTPFNPLYALVSSAAAVICTLGATLSACWAELRETPASLMLPKAPKAGKRIFLEYVPFVWKRLKFTQKVTARNLFRYKKRFFMTVIGIAGCTALLVTGFGVRDSISDIVGLQFGELTKYALTVGLKDPSALEGKDLQYILEDSGLIESYLPVTQEDCTVVPEGGDPEDKVTVMVPSDMEAMEDYYVFRHRNDHSPVEFKEDSVVITEKLSERQHLKVGDTITLTNEDGKEASFTITGICENYVTHYMYISPETYQEGFGEEAAVNSLLCILPEDITTEEEDGLTTQLMRCRDVAMASFTTELAQSFDNTISSINYIVIVLIVSAGLLAFVVLYNLTNINITEREKELATIKVLGFYDKEVSAYIYRETALLTLFGTAFGLLLGIFLHQFVIRTAEVDIVMFGRSIYPLSFLWSALLTIFFSILVDLVMHRKLKKISMVESMKAPE